MPDITIQINTPVLVGGESFKVRYRQLPAGAWSSYSTRSNAPFTLTGLSVGDYELEVIVVKGATECPAIIRPFKVVQPFSCITFDAEIVAAGSQFNLEITYTLPGGFTNPPCGWTIQAIGNTTNKSINYTTLPASPIKIPVANEGLLVRVIANLCNGKTQTCYEGDVLQIPAPCIPIVVSSVTFVPTGKIVNGKKEFEVTFNFTQSTPPTTNFVIGLNQTNSQNNPSQNYNPYTVSPTTTVIKIMFYADIPPLSDNTKYYFQWFIRDRCGNAFFSPPGSPIVYTP